MWTGRVEKRQGCGPYDGLFWMESVRGSALHAEIMLSGMRTHEGGHGQPKQTHVLRASWLLLIRMQASNKTYLLYISRMHRFKCGMNSQINTISVAIVATESGFTFINKRDGGDGDMSEVGYKSNSPNPLLGFEIVLPKPGSVSRALQLHPEHPQTLLIKLLAQ